MQITLLTLHWRDSHLVSHLSPHCDTVLLFDRNCCGILSTLQTPKCSVLQTSLWWHEYVTAQKRPRHGDVITHKSISMYCVCYTQQGKIMGSQTKFLWNTLHFVSCLLRCLWEIIWRAKHVEVMRGVNKTQCGVLGLDGLNVIALMFILKIIWQYDQIRWLLIKLR